MKNSKNKTINTAYLFGIIFLGVVIWGAGKAFLGHERSSSPRSEAIKGDTTEATAVTIERGVYSSTSEENAGSSDAENDNSLLVRGQDPGKIVPLIPNANVKRTENPLRNGSRTGVPSVAVPAAGGTSGHGSIRQVRHSEPLDETLPPGPAILPESIGTPSLPLPSGEEDINYPEAPLDAADSIIAPPSPLPAPPSIGVAPDDNSEEIVPNEAPMYAPDVIPAAPLAAPDVTLPGEPFEQYPGHIEPVRPRRIEVEYDPANEVEPQMMNNSSWGLGERAHDAHTPGISSHSETPAVITGENENNRFSPTPKVASSNFGSDDRIRSRVPVESGDVLGTGTPGAESLEGPQMPQLYVEKIAPSQIVLDNPTTFKTLIRNVGKVTARNVKVVDRIPSGAKLKETVPNTSVGLEGELVWDLGNLDPQQEKTIEMRLIPIKEGEIGSVATVMFSAESSAKTVVTKPMLKIEVKKPEQVTIGQSVTFDITISNPGSGTASNVVLKELVPDGLVHEKGKELVNKVGDIKPKETRRVMLTMQANQSGAITNYLCVSADHNLLVEDKSVVHVLAPQLKLDIEGSKQRYLERRAVYQLTVSNPGTAPANNVDLTLTLPTSLKFESTNQSGVYDPKTHKVHWALEVLPNDESGKIELVTVPTRTGEQQMKFSGEGMNHLKAEAVHEVNVDGLAATSFEVACLSDPVEIGKDAVYEIRVTNRGTKTAENIVVQTQLSKGMTFANAEGPAVHHGEDTSVKFEPLASLDPKKEKIYKIVAKCTAPGDHRIRVQVVSDDLQAPVTKEESTKVFADR